MKIKYLGLVSVCAFSLALVFAVAPSAAYATNGDVVVTATREFGGVASSTVVSFSCPGGVYTALSTTTTILGVASTSVETFPAAADCQNGEGIDIRVASTGYATKTLASTTSSYTYSTAAANAYSVTGILYGLKVVVADQLGSSVTPLTETTFRGMATTSANGSTLYWADTGGAGGVLDLRARGYVFGTSTNAGFGQITTAVGGQVVLTLGANSACSTAITTSSSCKGLETQLTVTSILNELGTDVMPTTGTPFSVGSDINLVSQTYSSGVWYIAASSTAAGDTLTASSTGYVSRALASVITSTTSQKSITYGGSSGDYNGSSLLYALKVTAGGAGVAGLTGATVTAGDSYSISCSESGSTAVYYCVVPTTDTGTTVQVSKTNFTTGTGTYTARTSYTDAQSTVSVTLNSSLVAATGYGGGGGGGGGGGIGTLVSDSTVVYPTVVPGCPVGFTCRLVSPVIPNCPTGFICRPASPGITSSNSAAAASVAGVSAVFTARLSVGADSPDVTRLRKLLASDSAVYPEGRVTGYFGPLTLKAVQAFQVKHGVAKPGDVGYGTVGPMTRATLQRVFGGAQ